VGALCPVMVWFRDLNYRIFTTTRHFLAPFMISLTLSAKALKQRTEVRHPAKQ